MSLGPRMVEGQRLTVQSEEETARVAATLAATLLPGSVVLLYGDLGAGKTAFVRGMAPALGIDPDEVSSPTFALVQPYAGSRVTMFHVDLYRLEGAEIEELGLDDLATDGVVVVEWAERLLRPPAGAIHVRLSDLGGDRRSIQIDSPGRVDWGPAEAD